MLFRTVCAASLVATLATPASAKEVRERPELVVAVFAHPDDELFVAPALAAAVRRGAEVRIIWATDGDQGPGISWIEKGPELGRVRSLEAWCAGTALGATSQVHLNLGDGSLGSNASAPDSSAAKLAEKLPRWLAGAESVITWGPDGGYGHSDHRMVSAVVTELVQGMDDEVRPTLLYPGIPSGKLPDIPQMAGWAETAPSLLTTLFTYDASDLAKSATAAQCHKTQFDEATRAGLIPLFDQSVWQGAVHFRGAF